MPKNAFCSFCRKSAKHIGPLVEGPGDVYICGECVELCQSIIDQDSRRRDLTRDVFASAEDLRKKLDQYLEGQESAKNALFLAVHDHYQRPGHSGPGAVLMVGPTRSSQLFLARALAHLILVPFAASDAAALLEDRSQDQLLHKLLEAAGFDVDAAGRGMIFIDGVDQPGVQGPLLDWMADAAKIVFGKLELNIQKILIVCGGRFPGLEELMARRGRHPEQSPSAEDLVACGLSPALAWSFRAVVSVAPLDEKTLLRIISHVGWKDWS